MRTRRALVRRARQIFLNFVAGSYQGDPPPMTGLEESLCFRIAELEDVVREMRRGFARQIDFWCQVPSGIDYDARADDESPEDLVAHIAGLAYHDAVASIKKTRRA